MTTGVEQLGKASRDQADVSTARVKPPRYLFAMAGLAVAAAGTWMCAVLLTAAHGFDITDEGFYVLSYRWWRDSPYAFTGAQYLYGPVFDLLGHDIALLRVFRLLTVVGAHAAFGWSFMRWLRGRRPQAPATRWWEATGTLVIVACGGLVHAWLPLSPGYNDVSVLGALVLAAAVAWIAADLERGLRIPFWVPAAAGAVAVAMVLAKWSSGIVTLVLVGAVVIVIAMPAHWRGLLRLGAWAAGGAVAIAALVHFILVPLPTAIPAMVTVNGLVAGGGSDPGRLIEAYLDNFADVLKEVVRGYGPLLLAALVAARARSRVGRWIAVGLVLLGGALAARQVIVDGAMHGGSWNLDRYPVALVTLVATAVVIGLVVVADRRVAIGGSSLRSQGRREWLLLGIIAVLPFAQAAGTNNAIFSAAINGFAFWVALIIAVLTGIEGAPRTARLITAAATAGAVLLSAVVTADGLLNHPYRTVERERATTAVSGVKALESIRVDPATAEGWRRLYERLRPEVEPAGRPIMAFDRMPGIVLLLNGRSVGESWYAANAGGRVAAGIRAECEDGHPAWGSRLPLLLFNRPVSEFEITALRACGLEFTTDYRLLAPKEETMGIEVYLPTDAAR